MNIHSKYMDLIFDEINLSIAIISRDNTLISANKALLDFARLKLEDIQGVALWELPWWQHSPELQNKLLFAINDCLSGQTVRFEASQQDYKGDIIEIDFIIKPIMEGDEARFFIAMAYNVTDLVSVRKELTERERRIKALFKYSNDGYVFLTLPDSIHKELVDDKIVTEILNHFIIESINQRLIEILGLSEINETNIFEVLGIKRNLNKFIYDVVHDGSVMLETEITIGENIRYLKISFVAIYDENKCYEGSFAIVQDVTLDVENLKNITYLANKDFLTGINNRGRFFKKADQMYSERSKGKLPTTVVMLDLDHFKRVNDTYGHEAGDMVIRVFAKLLEEEICTTCIIGRYGGEEFVAVVPYPSEETYKQLELLREKVWTHKFNYKERNIKITTSIGLHAIDYNCDSLESALNKADIALYESKLGGRNQSTIFVEEIHGKSSIDEITGILTEKSLGHKIKKSITSAHENEESIWFIYFKININYEDSVLTRDRHLKTMAMSILNVLTDRNLTGRYLSTGFIIGLKDVYPKTVEKIYDRIIDNLELGFSGMLDDMLSIEGTTFNGSAYSELQEIYDELEHKLEKLY